MENGNSSHSYELSFSAQVSGRFMIRDSSQLCLKFESYDSKYSKFFQEFTKLTHSFRNPIDGDSLNYLHLKVFRSWSINK